MGGYQNRLPDIFDLLKNQENVAESIFLSLALHLGVPISFEMAKRDSILHFSDAIGAEQTFEEPYTQQSYARRMELRGSVFYLSFYNIEDKVATYAGLIVERIPNTRACFRRLGIYMLISSEGSEWLRQERLKASSAVQSDSELYEQVLDVEHDGEMKHIIRIL
jgi:hypothetical protein